MERKQARRPDRAGVSPASLFNLPAALMDEAQITNERPSSSDGAAIVAERGDPAKGDHRRAEKIAPLATLRALSIGAALTASAH
jgi:hypothetical protein